MNRRRFFQTGMAALTTASLLTLGGSSPVQYKLGKAAATPERAKLKLVDYLTNVPTPPAVFGHQTEVPSGWGMLGNDTAGDCVWAGACHEHMLWTAEAGCVAVFTQADAFAPYAAVTGFVVGDAATDKGTNVTDALAYRVASGIADANNKVHKLEAYAQLTPSSDAIAQGAWLFSAVGVGIQFPSYAMAQFNAGQPWDVVRGGYIEGGHYVPIVGRLANGNLLCVTWGKLQEMTPSFLDKYCDEAYALFSPEFFVNGKSPEGFDAATLQADMAAIAT